MNLVSEVVSVRLNIHRVGGQVEVAGDFVDMEPRLEQAALVTQGCFDCILHESDLMSPHVILNVYS